MNLSLRLRINKKFNKVVIFYIYEFFYNLFGCVKIKWWYQSLWFVLVTNKKFMCIKSLGISYILEMRKFVKNLLVKNEKFK